VVGTSVGQPVEGLEDGLELGEPLGVSVGVLVGGFVGGNVGGTKASLGLLEGSDVGELLGDPVDPQRMSDSQGRTTS